MSNTDYYKNAIEIADELKREHLDDYSSKIKDSISAGSTGTEILMALRWNYKQILKENINKGLYSKILDLIKQIDECLD